MKEYMEQKLIEKAIDEYIERLRQDVIQRVEQDLAEKMAREVPKITGKEQEMTDSLQVVDERGMKKHKYQRVDDVESQHPEVSQQKQEELQIGSEKPVEKGKEYSFDRMEQGKLVYVHGSGKNFEEMHLSHRQLPLSAETRGKMIFCEFMQQMKSKDLKKMVSNALHVADRDQRPLDRVLGQMVHQKLAAFQNNKRNRLVQMADRLHQKMKGFESAVKDMDKVLLGQLQKLQQLPEKIRNHPQYAKVRDSLVTKQEKGQKALIAYQEMEKGFIHQLKFDLHAQYPDLKLHQLTLGEVNALSRSAAQINKVGIDELRNFISQSDDKMAIKALSQAEGHEQERFKDIDGQGQKANTVSRDNNREMLSNDMEQSISNFYK